MFEEDDVVLIGEGSCAELALRDAIAVDATPIILKTREMWLADVENGPLPESAIFDAGNVPQNREVQELLQRTMAGASVYLAGEIPLGTAFRAPPLEDFRLAFHGEHPRRLERRALEKSMIYYDFQPRSLHSIHCGNVPTSSLRDADHAQQLREDWLRARDRSKAAVANGYRPRFDVIRESTETALATERQGNIVFAVSWLIGPFDTAWFDQKLADQYRESEASMIVLDRQAILLESGVLTAHCGASGLDLYTIETGIK